MVRLRKKGKHNLPEDFLCPRCRLTVRALIPHECDPSICIKCDGMGYEWKGRDKDTREFRGYSPCDSCDGTGKTIWK